MTGPLLFAAGLASSMHCIGMCGGLPVLLARNGGRSAWPRQLAYNFARVNTLVAIGAVSGAVGHSLVQAGPGWWVERALPLVAGVFMLAIGLEMLGYMTAVTGRLAFWVERTIRSPLRATLTSNSIAAPIALGVFNAFLPCHLVYAFAAKAAATASIVDGMSTMLWFGLGTVPAMLAAGSIVSAIPGGLRRGIVTASGVLVIGFAIATIARVFAAAPEPCHSHGLP